VAISQTQVAIVGGGPAGTLLAHLLWGKGIESVVLERRTGEHVLTRIRAGVVEQVAAEVLRENGLGTRMDREGQVHGGVVISDQGVPFRIDFRELTGRSVIVYGQTELQKDLYELNDTSGVTFIDQADVLQVHNVASTSPYLTYTTEGREERLSADFIVGCDGAHSVTRNALPESITRVYERVYPFGWLGIMSETPPVNDELIYARHERGFALCSMRNPTLSRYYIQCPIDADLAEWSDDRFWAELKLRIPPEAAERLVTGPSIEKSVTPLRSRVIEPMGYGRLFLCGDAAHVVPPTGAKGLNLAVSDVFYLSQVLGDYYKAHDDTVLDRYSEVALRRVWRCTRFSWWMTTVLHRFPDDGAFAERLQASELDYLRYSSAARTAMAENYVGLLY
jgi:p-hydroxybenzoate 3-monooxygenase